jgi:4-deoxy-L-threo-5-hexosulose-uronate ketol-isomerase
MAMGITTLHEGSVWNTLPCHVHERRTEAYLYFDLDPNEKVIHLFGKPDQTRNFVMGNMDVVISPAWSIHTGAGTSQYKFVWSTAGENITYTDFTPVPTKTLG